MSDQAPPAMTFLQALHFQMPTETFRTVERAIGTVVACHAAHGAKQATIVTIRLIGMDDLATINFQLRSGNCNTPTSTPYMQTYSSST